jgi:hypothetical protein
VVDEVSATQLPQKSFLFVRTSNALQLLNFDIQFFALNYIPTDIFAEKARKSSSQEVS